MLLAIVLLIILAGAVACLWNRGIWTGMLTLINTIFAALLAMTFYEPFANLLGKDTGSNTLDFISLWLLFVVFSTLFRVVTDLTSRVRVRFPYAVDLVGAVLLSLWTGWIMFCFTVTTLHASPLARSPFGGAFMEQPDEKIMGIGPDRLWLAFTRQVSLGAFQSTDEGFDPHGEFVFKYGARRATGKK